jgi:hypothetical protein
MKSAALNVGEYSISDDLPYVLPGTGLTLLPSRHDVFPFHSFSYSFPVLGPVLQATQECPSCTFPNS